MQPGRRRLLGLSLIPLSTALVIALDQISKAWAEANLTQGAPQVFVPGILDFSLTSNTGVAFSLGSGHGSTVTILASGLTLLIVAWSIKRQLETPPPPLLESIGMGCIIGGAAGNLIDRFCRGRVTDFLDFAFMTFPVFNVADVLIDVGIGLVLIAAISSDKREKSNEHQ
ncbi:MAG: signal peptidase II [Candidatus Melainabacteria bacterium]|nr:signal peptidase II [Candidatus Melainabacteria bacterium]